MDDLVISGAKLVCLIGDRLVTILRDDRPDIPDPGCWDMPGGGCEPGENPEACVLREMHEEFGLALPLGALLWRRLCDSVTIPGTASVWFAARLPEGAEAGIVLGDEGQGWALMEPETWLAHPKSIPQFHDQVRAGLAALRA